MLSDYLYLRYTENERNSKFPQKLPDPALLQRTGEDSGFRYSLQTILCVCVCVCVSARKERVYMSASVRVVCLRMRVCMCVCLCDCFRISILNLVELYAWSKFLSLEREILCPNS